MKWQDVTITAGDLADSLSWHGDNAETQAEYDALAWLIDCFAADFHAEHGDKCPEEAFKRACVSRKDRRLMELYDASPKLGQVA